MCRTLLCSVLIGAAGCGGSATGREGFVEQLKAAAPAAADAALTAAPLPETPPVQAATHTLAWHALWQAQRDDAGLVAAARTLAQRLDPVWGGLLEYPLEQLAELPERPRFAKQLATQALALEVFASAYGASGEQQFANAFSLVDEYLQDWLRARDGSYAAGQLLQPNDLRPGLGAADYWGLRREHDRRALGIPPAQGQASAAAQVQLARAYGVAADVFAEARYLEETATLLDVLDIAPSLAAACSWFPSWLLATIERWGRSADAQLLTTLQARVDALLAARSADPACATAADAGALANMELALALQQHSLITGELTLNAAPALLRAVALGVVTMQPPAAQLPVLAREQQLTAGPRALLLAGDPTDPRWQQLQQQARLLWHPQRLLWPVSPATAAQRLLPWQPAIYACSPSQCALPVTFAAPIAAAVDPQALSVQLRRAVTMLDDAGPVAIEQQVPALLGVLGTVSE